MRLDTQRISVIDSGIGIKADELKKITSKFYRVKGNTWDNSMGLGLAIVDYILKIHQVELLIESEEGNGSTFSFELSPLIAEK